MDSFRRIQQVLNLRSFTESQNKAVEHRGSSMIVTAGAGSGKTRTLVARYLSLLAEDIPPQKIVAVTFTEKAAREMRNRIRVDLLALRNQFEAGSMDFNFWNELVNQMDSARIATIHSLCASLLRSHAAEAGLDPKFAVVDEGMASLYKAESVAAALAWAVEQPEIIEVFHYIDTSELEHMIAYLLNKRLEMAGMDSGNNQAILKTALRRFFQMEAVSETLNYFHSFSYDALIDDAGDKMARQIKDFVYQWEEIASQFNERSVVEIAIDLYALRRSGMDMRVGKRTSLAKAVFRDLRDLYDQELDPWIGGSSASVKPPDQQGEDVFKKALPLVVEVFNRAEAHYQQLLSQQSSLDFDDLESQATVLLQNPEIRSRNQKHIAYLLVDEFQDTNQRQREIIMALAGKGMEGLFLVGDAQQSIYRFRGADVEIFVDTQEDIQKTGGFSMVLETTFRTHKPLLDALEGLLAPVLSKPAGSERPFEIPFHPMVPYSKKNTGKYQEPFVEFILGAGEDSTQGREVAAQALIDRLLEMRMAGNIQSWNEVALLFRASSGFTYYEEAFAKAGIPYVTVSGKGFFDRPEIRDILNLLVAIADPGNDTAMAGFLRSPAIGLMDESLIRLKPDETGGSYYQKLEGYEAYLPQKENPHAAWALQILEEFSPLIDRLTIAEVLDKLIDRLNYRAILMAGGMRMVNNLDKLIEDARESQLIQVSSFLEYLRVSKDVGVRTGEAKREAQDAVQLMTIHASKGLEFGLVVLADAAHGGSNRQSPAILIPQTGLTIRLGRLDTQALLYKYAHKLEKERDEAEIDRLMYVALTRSRDKLIISGHCDQKGGVRGNLKKLGCSVPEKGFDSVIDLSACIRDPGKPEKIHLENGGKIRVLVHTEDTLGNETWESSKVEPQRKGARTFSYEKLAQQKILDSEDFEDENPLNQRDWRATKGHHAPALVVGQLVHKILQRWVFPEDPKFVTLVRDVLNREGVVDQAQQESVVQEASKLVERFREDDIYQVIEAAEHRRHEIPYALVYENGIMDTGVIDLLYRDEMGWHIIDFKTDGINDEKRLQETLVDYRSQIERYRKAVKKFLGDDVDANLVLLDVEDGVLVMN